MTYRKHLSWLAAILVALFVLSGCASSPEAKLVHGYQIVTASATGATTLLQRGHITKADAQVTLDLSEAGKATLDLNKDRLVKCRADEAAGLKVDCSKAVSGINLGSGVLLQLEQYLQSMEGK
jgi:hypothetical protein